MHELLRHQIRAHFGGEDRLPSELAAFVASVDRAYFQFEEAREDLDRSLGRKNEEVLAANVEMREVLDELTRQREFLRQVIDLNPHFIFAKDRAGRFTLVNRAVADAYGTSVENLLGKTDADFNPDLAEVEHFREDDLEVLRTGKDKTIPEERITDAAGNVRWLQTIKRALPAREGESPQILGVATDITQRREAEERLRERTTVALTHQAALGALALLDPQSWEAALERITETTSHVLGVARVGVWTLDPEEDVLVCEANWEDGRFNMNPGVAIRAENYPRYFRAVAESRTVAAHDARTDPRTSEFAEIYLAPLGITSMLDVPVRFQGRVVGVVCLEHVGPPRVWSTEEQHFAASIADFVSLARAARRRRELEAELRQSQKMEAIGHLAGGIAHDFNNLLTAMLGYCQMVLVRLPPSDPNRAQIELVKQAADRAADLTRQLLAFSRKQVLTPRVLDLNQVIVGVHGMLARVIGEDVSLTLDLAPDLGRIRADRSQLEQVLLNLVVNARDAMPEGGRLHLRTRNLPPRPGSIGTGGGFVTLSVTDTGIGMNSETAGRIFEPFFTTKEPGRGTGLGLSTVYGIVKQSGGNIAVESEPGRGASFTIQLPRVEAELEAEPARTAAPAGAPPTGTENVLLVEDEPQVRMLIRKILERHGYHVLEARDGHEALTVSKGTPETIHLLLTDVVMPRMNGRQLYEGLRSARPGLAVLFMSGYTETAVVSVAPGGPEFAFIQKPFEPDRLVRKIREVLDHAKTVPAGNPEPHPAADDPAPSDAPADG